MLKKILIKVIVGLACVGILAAGSFAVVWFKYRNIRTLDNVTEGFGCVIHKSKPVQLPQNYLVIFIRHDGGEFYIEDKGVYEKIEDGDCIKYRYHEMIEYDSSEGGPEKGRTTGYSYDIKFLEKRINRNNNTTI